jgi:hypothetical protein
MDVDRLSGCVFRYVVNHTGSEEGLNEQLDRLQTS